MTQNEKIGNMLEAVTAFILDKQTDGAWPMRSDSQEPNRKATALAVTWLQSYKPSSLELEARAEKALVEGINYLREAHQPIKVSKGQREAVGWLEFPNPNPGPITVDARVSVLTAMVIVALVRSLQVSPDQDQKCIDTAKRGLNGLRVRLQRWSANSNEQKQVMVPEVYWSCIALKEAHQVNFLQLDETDRSILHGVFDLIKLHQKKDDRSGSWGEYPFNRASPPALDSTASLTYLLLKYSSDPHGEVAQRGLSYTRDKYSESRSDDLREKVRAGLTLLESGEGWLTRDIRKKIRYEIDELIRTYSADTYGWSYEPGDPPDLSATHSVCRLLLAYQQYNAQGGSGGS